MGKVTPAFKDSQPFLSKIVERLRMVIGALYTQPLNYGTISLKRSNKQKQYLFSKTIFRLRRHYFIHNI